MEGFNLVRKKRFTFFKRLQNSSTGAFTPKQCKGWLLEFENGRTSVLVYFDNDNKTFTCPLTGMAIQIYGIRLTMKECIERFRTGGCIEKYDEYIGSGKAGDLIKDFSDYAYGGMQL